LRESQRREELTAAHWASIRLERAGLTGDDLQEGICRLANVAPAVVRELKPSRD